MFSIISEAGYIAVTFSGYVTFSMLLESFLNEASMPDYHYKNRIWIFKEHDDLSLSMSAITSAIPIITNLYPKHPVHNKTAIVMSNCSHKAVAGIFAREDAKIPYCVGLFRNLESAVMWVNRDQQELSKLRLGTC
jgi:hypothetical protein